MNDVFNQFVDEQCIVRTDVEERSTELEGRFRIWRHEKPKKDTFHALKNYLDFRFKPKKIMNNKFHGYVGIKLREVTYDVPDTHEDINLFVRQGCKFSNTGKILNHSLLSKYQEWKKETGRTVSENDYKELKQYFNNCPHTLKAVVYLNGESNDGYYGISLKNNTYNSNYAPCTGKKVYKRDSNTNTEIKTWNSIADAAKDEGISAPKMSRLTKGETVINDYYYSLK